MNVLVTVDNLGQDMGFNFSLSANTGSVSPSTCNYNQLLDGIIVTVDPATTGITICSIGLCTDCITIPVTLTTTTTTTTAEPTTTTTTTTAEPTTTTTTTTAEPTTTTTTTTSDGYYYYTAYFQTCGSGDCQDNGGVVTVRSLSSLSTGLYSEGSDNSTVYRIVSATSQGSYDYEYSSPISRTSEYCCL